MATTVIAPAQVDDEDAYLAEFGYQPELSRVLGKFASFAIQYSTIAMIGGLVAVFGLGLADAGPSLLWVWLVGGALQMIVALCAAEACSAYPIAGGAYNIVGRLSHRGLGWMTGWSLECAHVISVTASSVAIAPVVASWLGFNDLAKNQLILFSGGLIVMSTLVNLFGVRLAAVFNNLGVWAELAAVVLIVAVLGAAIVFSSHHTNSPSTLAGTGGQVHTSLFLALAYGLFGLERGHARLILCRRVRVPLAARSIRSR